MKKKALLSMMLAAALSFGAMGAVQAEETETAAETGTEAESAAEPFDGEAFLGELAGTYKELFSVIGAEENKEIWTGFLSAYTTDEDEIETYYQMLVGSCTKEIYGQEAINAYAETPEDAGFDCSFLADLAEFTVDGSTISGVDADGNELFSHTYHYVEDAEITYMGQGLGAYHHIYESDDADSGAFTYFAFTDDTTAATYHLEFRYGESLENLSDYTEGDYAYWNAAAISVDYDEQLLNDCIQLFMEENVAG